MASARGTPSSTSKRRDFNQMERVRRRAARMVAQGTSQAEVAHRLGTSRQNAHRWHRRWQQGGRAALRAAGRAGRNPKLDSRALRRVERARGRGAPTHGFDGDLGTLQRVALVIEGRTGIRHIPGTCGASLGRWADPPATQRRASERDEAATARWVKTDGPRIRQTRAAARRRDRGRDESGSASPGRCGGPGRLAAAPRSCGTASATGRGCRWPRCAAIGPTAPARGWRSTSSRAATTTSC
jgi:transposase